LADDSARTAIAAAGQRRAIEKNNYRTRTAEILEHIAEMNHSNPGRASA
jgi:spore maturation protein CgeB